MGDLETANTNESKGTLNPSNESGSVPNPSNESGSISNPSNDTNNSSNESKSTSNNTNNSSKNGVGAWIDKNMTPYVVERCADIILLVMNKIFIAPYDVALELLDIIRNRKYSKYIVGFWSVIGITALVFSIILFVLADDFPLNAWSLGIVIASLIVILLGKHPVKIDVTTDLTKEIEESIKALNNKPVVNDSIKEEELTFEEEEEELVFDDEEEEELVFDDEEGKDLISEEEEDKDLISEEEEDKDLISEEKEDLDDSLNAFLDSFDDVESFNSSFNGSDESFNSSFEDNDKEDELNNFLDNLSNDNYSKVNPGDFFDSVNSNNKDIL